MPYNTLLMDEDTNGLESLWESLLSRQPERVKDAFLALREQEKAAVFDHLQRMASEEGWHPEQRRSAREALQALNFYPGG
jgi:hypothetical protein